VLRIILISLVFSLTLSAKYTNCGFVDKNYTDICKDVVKKGVSYDYANRFLLSYFKTKKYDEITWKYIQPKYISVHRAKEKKANNILVQYIPRVIKHLKRYEKVYDYSEKRFHVNREIIASILLKETKLGKIPLKHDAFIVFNTILTRAKPTTERAKRLIRMSKTNMSSIINYCYKNKIQPNRCNLPSSFAGAVGIAQFMPNSFIYAQGYKKKYANLNNMSDAIVSTAKFLNQKTGFKKMIVYSKMKNIKNVESQWYDYAYKYKNSSFINRKSKHCFACNKKELNYISGYIKNILRYNNSSNYAIGVLRIAYEVHKKLLAK